MDLEKYEPVLIGIDHQGRWYLDEHARHLLAGKVNAQSRSDPLALAPGADHETILKATNRRGLRAVDVVFPVLHGPFGEDGTVQGLLKLVNLPFVGAGVLGSAVGMDKDTMKRLLRDAQVPIAKFLVFDRSTRNKVAFAEVKRTLGFPVFVKPANLGSSVGISKANDAKQLTRATRAAFRYDNKILIEEFIAGREIECSVLGNDRPIASLPGEIVTCHDFYSYEAKYVDDKGASLEIPARLPAPTVKKIQALAVKAFKALCCEGMARVDFFLKGNGEILVNEINTIPGFTKISMYPKLWEASGLSYRGLIDRLIQLALDRFRKESHLRTVFTGR